MARIKLTEMGNSKWALGGSFIMKMKQIVFAQDSANIK